MKVIEHMLKGCTFHIVKCTCIIDYLLYSSNINDSLLGKDLGMILYFRFSFCCQQICGLG